jgi:hypothetical protein
MGSGSASAQQEPVPPVSEPCHRSG